MGLVAPGTVLMPYDLHMGHLRAEERHAWADRVVDQLEAAEGGKVWLEDITILAGKLYVEPLSYAVGDRQADNPQPFNVPLQGLGVGQRLAWFKRELA